MWDLNKDNTKDIQQEEELFKQLVNKALKGEHFKFEFLRCWEDRNIVKQYIFGVTATIRIFSDLVKTTTATYVDQIKKDSQDLGLILALKQFVQCRDYYEQELFLAKDILNEYWSYIFGGHIWDTLIGNIRKDEDMVDYRTLPVKWF